MSASGVENNLVQAVKDLSLEWQQTRTCWRDIKSQEFEKKYLENLSHHVARARVVIAEINVLLRKVRTDCG